MYSPASQQMKSQQKKEKKKTSTRVADPGKGGDI
jgi:hypothetical protein